MAAEEFDWDPFIGRALGYLCLHLGDMRKQSVLEQAEFLMSFGLPRREAATIVGSTDDSVRVLMSNKAKKTKAATKGAS
jgi:hypothetical protein